MELIHHLGSIVDRAISQKELLALVVNEIMMLYKFDLNELMIEVWILFLSYLDTCLKVCLLEPSGSTGFSRGNNPNLSTYVLCTTAYIGFF